MQTHLLLLLSNTKLIIYLLLLLSFNEVFTQNDNEHNTKYWSVDDKLKVQDFESDTISNRKMSAASRIMLDHYIDSTKNIIYIRSIFSKKLSYFPKKTNYLNLREKENFQNLLKHEQGHFDILELHARKLRKKLLKYYQLHDELEDNIFYEFYDTIIKDYKNFSRKYEEETNHSRNKENQKKWNLKIEVELKKLEELSYNNYLKKFSKKKDNGLN